MGTVANDVDVLVIGAGACGLAAAVSAHDAGASVAIVEKLERAGGNSALSTGSIPAAGTRFQREAGIEDSPAAFVRDLMRIAGDTEDPALVERLAATSADLVHWLVDVVGARLALVTAYKHIGHSVPRLHAPVSRRGRDLVDDLLAAVERREIPLALGNPVESLIVEDGAVAGARIAVGGEVHEIRAAKTILAVNGFAAAPELVRAHCAEIAGASYFGSLGSTGEAVQWGMSLGADLANMGAYQGYAAVAHPHGSLLSWTTIEKGGVLVGSDGRRFGNESLGYSGYAKAVLAQGEFAWAVFDQTIFDIAALEEEFVELVDYGGVRKASSAREAAQIAGIDPAGLEAEIALYNASARDGAGDRFGRADFGHAPLQPPLYICRVTAGLFHTQGGLRVDGEGHVLSKSGGPIGNLFAGGGAAAGISGRNGALGYASGNGLLTAAGLGRIAGLAAAREASEPTGAATRQHAGGRDDE